MLGGGLTESRRTAITEAPREEGETHRKAVPLTHLVARSSSRDHAGRIHCRTI